MANYLEPEATATCLVSFCETLPFLAAGTTPAAGVAPSLSILHCRSERRRLFSAADCFYAPSPFASLGWSSPVPNTYLDGLIAGGLYNGGVAIWELEGRHRSAMGLGKEVQPLVTFKEGHFWQFGPAPKETTKDRHRALLPGKACDTSIDGWVVDDEAWDDNVVSVPGKEAWTPSCLLQFRSNQVRRVSPSTTSGLIGYFGDPRHIAPVRGVGFCPTEPHMLASGAGDLLALWDVTQIGSSLISYWESARSSTIITGLEWSYHDRNVLAFAALDGLAALVDVRTGKPTDSVITQSTRTFSSIKFSPRHDHLVAVSCVDDSKYPALMVWDLRKLGKSNTALRQLCESSGGVRCLSWNRKEDLIVAGTSSGIEIYNDKEVVSLQPSDPCIDIAWSHVDNGSFVASFEKSLASYKLDD